MREAQLLLHCWVWVTEDVKLLLETRLSVLTLHFIVDVAVKTLNLPLCDDVIPVCESAVISLAPLLRIGPLKLFLGFDWL